MLCKIFQCWHPGVQGLVNWDFFMKSIQFSGVVNRFREPTIVFELWVPFLPCLIVQQMYFPINRHLSVSLLKTYVVFVGSSYWAWPKVFSQNFLLHFCNVCIIRYNWFLVLEFHLLTRLYQKFIYLCSVLIMLWQMCLKTSSHLGFECLVTGRLKDKIIFSIFNIIS